MKKYLYYFVLFISAYSQAQTVNKCPTCWQPVIRQNILFNQNIPSTSIRGFVEFLPNGYNPNGTQKYPLIINLQGQAQTGSGNSADEVCLAACAGATIKLEQFRFPETIIHNGTTYSFIVLTPQYNGGTSGDDLAAFIDYAISRYRVDATRIYLTGLSLGSNFIMGYMGSSPQNAKKIAAIVPLAVCTDQYFVSANNIATQKVHYWGLHCAFDNYPCHPSFTTNWATTINNVTPANPMATATLTPLYNAGFPHDIFSTIYDINWKNLPENVFQKHITEWMVQFSQSAAGSLPATLSNYKISLKNKQVSVEWVTNLESNTDYFVIERAGPDMQFKQISSKITAAGNSSNPISYSFTDPQPLKGSGFYRLILINKDGLPDIYDIKKVSNREFGANFSLGPIPARKAIQLSFELEESQKLNFSIRDINGRLLRSWSANFTSGNASLSINIDELIQGVYYLGIQGTRFSETKKFIRQ